MASARWCRSPCSVRWWWQQGFMTVFLVVVLYWTRQEERSEEAKAETSGLHAAAATVAAAVAAMQKQQSKNEDFPGQIERKKQPLEFVHIPKTGGSSIEYVAAKHGIAWSSCHYEAAIAQKRQACPPSQQYVSYSDHLRTTARLKQWAPFWHIPPKFLHAVLLPSTATTTETVTAPPVHPYPDGTPLFAVVRHPYTRIVSEWYFKNQRQQKSGAERYNNATHFNKFLKQVLTIVSRVKPCKDVASVDMTRQNLYWIHDGHFIPQYDYIYDNDGTQIVKHVLKFESLEQDFANLMAQYNLKAMTLGQNETMNVSQDKKLSVLNLTRHNLALLHRVYHRDFEAFGYDRIQLDPSSTVPMNDNPRLESSGLPSASNATDRPMAPPKHSP